MLFDSNLKVLLLGGFNIHINHNPVKGFSYNKMRALLAYLAVEQGKDHSREFLSELLWSDYGATTARDNLRRALSNLRRTLESPTGCTLFSVTNHTIRFNPNVYVDAIEFTGQVPNPQYDSGAAPHHEERLIALYRGEFLKGLSLPECPEFEDWIQMKREILHVRALSVLEKISNHYAQMGDYSKALQFSLRHTELEPWDEDAHRQAMRLFALNGQNSAAIQQYEICCRLLKNELAILPNDKTRQLAEQIRNNKLQRRLTDTTMKAPLPQQTTPLPSIARRSSVERRGKQRRATPSERRQVSVLYCELIVAAINDLDEAMELLCTPQTRCAEIIQQLSGHIAQTHGGGLLAYFGYPQVHEDAARRAVQAALAVSRETSHAIEIRASVHTGLIITGSESSMPDMVGITSKLAIRLRHFSTYDVAISQETQRIVAGYFDCISLGVQSLPDFAQPLEIFKVVSESAARTRLDAAAQLTPFTGRKAEIAELMALWEEAAQGVRHVALIQGEAGIGKSRLLHTLKERLADQPHLIRELRCFPEFSQSPFHPLIVAFEANLGFTHGDTPEVKFGKLVKYLKAHYPASAQDTVPLLTHLLSLPLVGHYHAPGLSPQKQKEQTIAILLDLLQALSAQQPVLLIVEDLHWIDPSTLELLTQFVEQKESGAILAVFTARPEFDPLWKGALDSTLTLAPLAEDEVAQMIASLTEDIPAATVRRIMERADGVPLFVEEIAKITTLDNQGSIPTTLHDLLAARMDNLGEAKYTAQLAATLGREFDLDLLSKVSSCDPAALAHSLSALQATGLILKVNETVCQFKHVLIQEAAYQSQIKTDRQTAHRRIAQALLSDFSDVVTTQPELLAQHFSSGGETQQSIEYWIKAGQRAALNSANLEAIGHFNSGLQLLVTLPPEQDRDRTEFKMLISLCSVLYAAKGYGSEEAKDANARISALSGLVGDSLELFLSEWALVVNTIGNVGSRGMPEVAMQLLNMAHDAPPRKLAAHFLVAKASFWLGEFESARVHSEQAIALYNPDQLQMMLEQFGTDLSVFCAGYLSNALYFLGFPDRAQRVSERMLEQARELPSPHTLAQALCSAAVLHRWLNKPTEALSLSEEAIAISRQHDFSLWLVCGEMTHGWALVMHGQDEIGTLILQSSITGMRAATGAMSVYFLSALVEAYLHLERHNEALDLIAKALADTVNTGDGHFTAELHRFKGVCLLALSASNAAQAESCFDQALAISRRQGAKSLELRATMSMARLWQQQGKHEDARRMLEEIYNGFTEGFDTPDLQEAASLIRQE